MRRMSARTGTSVPHWSVTQAYSLHQVLLLRLLGSIAALTATTPPTGAGAHGFLQLRLLRIGKDPVILGRTSSIMIGRLSPTGFPPSSDRRSVSRTMANLFEGCRDDLPAWHRGRSSIAAQGFFCSSVRTFSAFSRIALTLGAYSVFKASTFSFVRG